MKKSWASYTISARSSFSGQVSVNQTVWLLINYSIGDWFLFFFFFNSAHRGQKEVLWVHLA